MPKCKWCKEDGEKLDMICHSKPTGKFNKNGTEKLIRSYYHPLCESAKLADDEFKEAETKELDALYNHIRKVHNIDVLDGRMFEKIQDLRNGSVKMGSKKVTRYKEGVTYSQMLDTYLYIQPRVENIILSMSFKTKWNEFSYIFGTMINNLNEVKSMQKRKERSERPTSITSTDFDIKVNKPVTKKKDEMDISEFL